MTYVQSAQINSNVKFSEKSCGLTTNDFEKFSEFWTLCGTEKINSLDDGIYINRKISKNLRFQSEMNLTLSQITKIIQLKSLEFLKTKSEII